MPSPRIRIVASRPPRFDSGVICRKEPTMFFRILVPLDGSKLAQRALPYALALASAVDAPITLLSVVPPMQMLTDYYVPYNAATEAVQLADAGDALDALAQSLRTHGVRVTTAVAVGDAADQILRYTEE